MKGRIGLVIKNQAPKLIAVDAPNYQVNFSCSAFFTLLGVIAKVTDSSTLAVFSFMFATGTALVGIRQWNAARFFPQQPNQSASPPSAGAEVETFHDAAEPRKKLD